MLVYYHELVRDRVLDAHSERIVDLEHRRHIPYPGLCILGRDV
nr:MAG TPA: hypothetical protein [Bacteriophage sp.]